MSQKRESNFELLRIISMLSIVVYHFFIHTGFPVIEDKVTINQLYLQFIAMGGKIGVLIFILISGYFLINSSNIKISKILKLWSQLFFYSVGIYIIFVVCGLETVTIKGLVKKFFPILFGEWWFASTYFVLYLFSPYINMFLTKLDKQTYKKLLILMTIVWVIIPTFSTKDFESNNLIYFFYLYSIGAYIKLWKNDLKIKNSKCFILIALTAFLTYSTVIIFDIMGLKYTFFRGKETYFYNLKSLPILIMSILIFISFKNLKIKHSKIINTISMATFGVYLIHDNGYIRTLIWKNILPSTSMINSLWFIPYSILAIISVYATCTIIELLRIFLIEKYYMKLINKLEPKINSFMQKIYDLPLIKNL